MLTAPTRGLPAPKLWKGGGCQGCHANTLHVQTVLGFEAAAAVPTGGAAGAPAGAASGPLAGPAHTRKAFTAAEDRNSTARLPAGPLIQPQRTGAESRCQHRKKEAVTW